jgi:hypothetical protein
MKDPMIEAVKHEQRDRRFLVVFAVIGIVTSAACGVGFSLGALGAVRGAYGDHSVAPVAFFVTPFAVCMGVGYLMYRLRRARRG